MGGGEGGVTGMRVGDWECWEGGGSVRGAAGRRSSLWAGGV